VLRGISITAAVAAEEDPLARDLQLRRRAGDRNLHPAHRVDRGRRHRARRDLGHRPGRVGAVRVGVILGDHLGQDRDGDLVWRPSADVQARGSVKLRAELRGNVELGPHDCAALRARHQRHVRHPGGQRRGQHRLLPVAVRGDDHGGRLTDITGVADGRQRTVVAGGLGELRDRLGDRRSADDHDPQHREARLQEDLQRPAAQARVVLDHRALDRIARSPAGFAVTGYQAQQQRLAGLHRSQRVEPHRGLGAHSADEPVDRAVREDDRGGARPGAGGPSGPNHSGEHERPALGDQALDVVCLLTLDHC
jgi:hypothetical protein